MYLRILQWGFVTDFAVGGFFYGFYNGGFFLRILQWVFFTDFCSWFFYGIYNGFLAGCYLCELGVVGTTLEKKEGF